MSNKHYNAKWQETIIEVQDLIEYENAQNDPDFLKKPPRDLFQYYAQNYIRYLDIYKRLEDSYDQVVHPQKRILLKEMLELTILRMVENKKSIIAYNTHSNSYQSDMVNLDELITDLKLTPDRLEVSIPKYFVKESDKERLDERNQIIDKLLIEMHDTCEPEEWEVEEQVFQDTNTETMIKLIQTMERGRQGIERGLAYKLQRKVDQKKIEKNKKLAEGEEIAEETERHMAMLVVQKYWRGFKNRELIYAQRAEELNFLGIKRALEDPKDPNSEYAKATQQRERMNIIQQQNYKEYMGAQVSLKQLVQENEGPEIKEKKIQERIEWIDQYLDKTEGKKLPARATDYYDVKKRLPPSLEELEAMKGGKKGKKDEKKDAKKGKKGKKDAKEVKKETVNLATVMKINDTVDQFQSTWGSINDAENFSQTYVTDIAKAQIRTTVDAEMNGLIDGLIEIELDNRHLFLLKKPRKKPAKPRPPKKTKPIRFKVPGAGACKGKNPLDLLAELVDAGIVKKLMPAKLEDLRGGVNVLGAKQEEQFLYSPDPSYQQLRAAITEFIAMPLGSPFLKASLDRMAYFLFFGPSGSGKTLAVRALATECNAMLLDLTPSNIATRVSDKASIGKTFYMTFQVAKHFHPSIIFMDEIDTVFGPAKKKKGVPAAAWVKLKKPLQDFKKQKFIEAASRVAFIGCTNNPVDCMMKDTKNYFEKKFFFPILNYDTRLMLWQYFIEKKIKVEPNFAYNTLALLTEGYTAGTLKQVIDSVLSATRIKRLDEEPLKVEEFITPLSKAQYMRSGEAYERLRQFMDEVTGTKDRRDKSKQVAVDPKKGGKGKGKK